MASKTALRFKIRLVGIRPPIWRRIEVPGDYTFWDLHVAIQDAMGWEGYHLHEFQPGGSRGNRPRGLGAPRGIGIPDPDGGDDMRAGWKVRLSLYFREPGDEATYIYDFGDDWHHKVVLEAVEKRSKAISEPVCLGGRRACPPEDCGGVGGYYDLVEALSGGNESETPRDDDFYEAYKDFDPAAFHRDGVVFMDPQAMLAVMLDDTGACQKFRV